MCQEIGGVGYMLTLHFCYLHILVLYSNEARDNTPPKAKNRTLPHNVYVMNMQMCAPDIVLAFVQHYRIVNV